MDSSRLQVISTSLSLALLQRFCNASSGWSLTMLEAEFPQVKGHGRLVQGQAHLNENHYLKQ